MVKPIQDALAGVVYVDDNQVTDVQASRRSLDGRFKVKGMSGMCQ
jgi:crossover junction endodeoxyribonuclease RusA